MNHKCTSNNKHNEQCKSKVEYTLQHSVSKYCKFHFDKQVNENTFKIKCLKNIFNKYKNIFNFNSYIIQLELYEKQCLKKNYLKTFDSFRHILNVLKLDIISSISTFQKRDFKRIKYLKLIKNFCYFLKKFDDKFENNETCYKTISIVNGLIIKTNKQIVKNDSVIVVNDSEIVENDSIIVMNDLEIVENDSEIVENDSEIVENDLEIVENDLEIVENDLEFVEHTKSIDDFKSITVCIIV